MKKIFNFLCLLYLIIQTTHAQPVIVGSENFDGPPHQFTISSSGGAIVDNNYSLSNSKSLWMLVPIVSGDSIIVTTPVYDCEAYEFVALQFSHICKVSPSDLVRIQYRPDYVGETWKDIPSSAYRGKASNYASSGFNAQSYTIWNNADSTAIPSNSWWKNEVFNLSNQASFAKVQFRFIIKKRDVIGSDISYGWLIDDFKVLGSSFEIDAPVCEFISNVSDTVYNTGPYTIKAKVATRTSAPILPPSLVYTASHPVARVHTETIAMTAYEGDSLWTATIPQHIFGTTIKYSIHAEDSAGNYYDNQNTFVSHHATGGISGMTYIGDTTSTTTTNYVPYYYNYDYSWTKTLYLSSEVSSTEQGGLISNLAYQVMSTSNRNDSISIYFKATKDNVLNSTYVDPIQDGASLVWSGTCIPNVGWYDLELHNRFMLPPGQNLLIYVISNDGSYSGNGAVTWTTSPAPATNMCYYKYADGSFPTSAGTASTSRPNIRLNLIGNSSDDNSVGLTEIYLNDTVITYPTLQVPVAVKIHNKGFANLTSATINWTLNGIPQTTYNWTGNMPDDYYCIDTIGNYTPRINQYDTIIAWVSMPNGAVDTTTWDDTTCIISFGSADIVFGWVNRPQDTVYTTGPHNIKLKAYSLSEQPIPDLNLVYRYVDTTGTVVDSNLSLPMTYTNNNIWSVYIPNVLYHHNVEFSVTINDSLNNIVSISEDYFINRLPSGGQFHYVYVEDTNTSYIVENVPFADLYDYSWGRILYKSNELTVNGGDHIINTIAYKPSERYGNGPTYNISCYMKLVTDSVIDSEEYIDPIKDNATLVWSGNLNAIQNVWLDIPLDVPFFVPSHMNLLVYWLCEDGTYNSDLYWYSSMNSIDNHLCVSWGGDQQMDTEGWYDWRPITRFHLIETREEVENSVAIQSFATPTTTLPAGTHPVSVVIRNMGTNNLESCDINWSVNGVEQPAIAWTGFLPPDFIDTVNIGSVVTNSFFYDIKVWVSMPNDIIDSTSFFDDTISTKILTCPASTVNHYTMGHSGSDFTNLADFVKIVSECGLNGTTVLEINDGEYYQASCNLTLIAERMDITDTLIITSVSGDPSDVRIIFSDSGFVLAKNKNIYIQNITIDVSSKTSMIGVLFTHPCDNIEINNCIINASPTATSSTSIGICYYGSSSKTANGDLRILNNTINGGYYGIRLYYLHPNSTSIANNPGIATIKGNTINNFYYYGIYAYYYGRYDFISNNTITSRNASAAQYGMYIYYYNRVDSGIIGNTIEMQGTSTSYGIYPYYLNHGNTGATNNALIANNVISKRNAGTFYGIYVYYSNMDVFHNTIVGRGSGTDYCLYLSTMSSTYNAVIKNNMLISQTSSTKYPLYASNTNYVLQSYGVTLDYNNYYSTTNVGYVGGALTSIGALQDKTKQDVHSMKIQPEWIKPTEFDVYNHLDLLVPNIGVNTDIKGNPRYGQTTVGAYSIIPDSLDLALGNFEITTDNGVSTINVDFLNLGQMAINSATILWTLDSVLQTPFNWTGNLANFSDVTSISLGSTTKGKHFIEIWLSDVNGIGIDNNQYNDTIISDFFACGAPLAGTYTVGDSASDYLTIDDALYELSQCGVSAPVTFNIATGTYSTFNVYGNIPGASTINTITFTSATGNADDVEFVAMTGDTALVLNNAAHLRFTNLTFDATAGNIGVCFVNDNSHIDFYQCNIKASPTSTASTSVAVRYYNSSSSGTTLYDVNFVKNNISGGYYSFYLYYVANSGSVIGNSSVRIDSNNITDYYYYGIYLYYYGYYPSVSYNMLSSRTGTSTQYHLNAYYYVTIDTMQNNIISMNSTGTQYGIRLYYNNYYNIKGSTSPRTLAYIVNNEIRQNPTQLGTGTKYGIYSYYTTANILNNSVYLTSTSGTCYGLYIGNQTSSYNLRFLANMLHSTTTTGSNYPIYASTATYATTTNGTTLDYNNYSSNQNTVGYIGTAMTSMAALRNATYQDVNSISVNPIFIDTNINLDVYDYSPFACPNLADIDYDIRGRRRGETTVLGAYSMETIDGKSIELVEILGLPDSNDRCSSGPSTISYVITGKGAVTVNFPTDTLYLHLNISGTKNWDTVVIWNKGTLPILQKITIPIMNNFELVDSGDYYISAWISNGYDTINVDDSLFTSYTIHKISLPFDENFSQGWSSSFTLEECNSENTWEIVNTNSDGTILPQYGTNMLSFKGSRGAISAIYTRQIDLSKTSEPKLDFWYWHDNTASTMDYTNVKISLDGGASFQTIAIIRKNDGSNSGWTYYSLPLDNFNAPCVIVSFSAMRWTTDDYNGEQLIDRIRIYGKHDLAISEIISSDYDICNLTGRSLGVVLNATTSLNIDFSSMPTELQVNISGAKNASYTLPLNNGIIEGLAFDTLVIDNNFDFIPGTYYISASIATAIDSNQANDFVLDTIEINPNISVAPTQITGGTSFANCVAIGSEVFQEVNISNSGNMDMTDILLTLNIYDVSGVIVQTYNDTINGDFPVGQELTYTFTKAYIVPEDETYNVEVIVSPLCDNNFKYVNYVTECVDLTDIELVSFVVPEDNADCSNVGDKQNVTVKISNKNPNVDMSGITIHAIISSNGNQINAWRTTIDEISAGTSIDFTFAQSFTIPEENDYTIDVYIDKVDDANNNDTLSITKCINLGISETDINTIGMSQNIPNPANEMAIVNYTIPSQGKVVFTIASITGQILHTQEVESEAGVNSIEFNTANLAAGIYFYTMDFNGQRLTKKMTIKK